MQLAHLQDLIDNLQEVESDILDDFSDFEGPIDLLDSISGIGLTAAYAILAEIGRDMSAFSYCSAHLLLGRSCTGQSSERWQKEETTHHAREQLSQVDAV